MLAGSIFVPTGFLAFNWKKQKQTNNTFNPVCKVNDKSYRFMMIWGQWLATVPYGCQSTAWWLSNDCLIIAWQRPNISMCAWQPQPEDQFITTAKFVRDLRVLTFFRAIYHARKAWCTQTFHQGLIQATPFMNSQQVLLAQAGKAGAIVAFSHLISTKILLGDFDGNTILTTLGNLQNK